LRYDMISGAQPTPVHVDAITGHSPASDVNCKKNCKK
jgi:hypothetical protein